MWHILSIALFSWFQTRQYCANRINYFQLTYKIVILVWMAVRRKRISMSKETSKLGRAFCSLTLSNFNFNFYKFIRPIRHVKNCNTRVTVSSTRLGYSISFFTSSITHQLHHTSITSRWWSGSSIHIFNTERWLTIRNLKLQESLS